MTDIRPVYYVSDRTGITARTLGHTLLTQFPHIEFREYTLPFINNKKKAQHAVSIINAAAESHTNRPLVFDTLVDDEIKAVIAACNGKVIDFFDTFIQQLENELHEASEHIMGKSHGINNDEDYLERMDALNYSLNNDDGISTKHYDEADVILIGASRSGKTPSCLYLALQYGINAANYPIIDEDLASDRLPKSLHIYRDKLIGLTINPERLNRIREQRRPGSEYASLPQCTKEIKAIEGMYQNEGITVLDTSQMSIEEISTTIVQMLEK